MSEVSLRVAHRTPGRVRLLAPAIEQRPVEGRRLAETASAIPGVTKAEARSTTGSLVIFHTGEWEEIAGQLGAALGGEISEFENGEFGGIHAMDATAGVVEALERAASRAFGRRTDLSELAFLSLLTAAAVQVARGEIFGPAATLLSQALNLMAIRRGRGRPA